MRNACIYVLRKILDDIISMLSTSYISGFLLLTVLSPTKFEGLTFTEIKIFPTYEKVSPLA